MADNTRLSAGTADGATIATDDVAGVHYQILKLAFGALDTATLVSASVGMPVTLLASTAAIGKLAANDGVDIGNVDVASIAAGDNNIGNVDIVTVPAPLSTTGGGTEATALRVTLASDSTGVVSIDDNGGSLTVDGSVTAVSGTAANLKAEVTLAAAQTLATLTTITNVVHVDDNSGTLSIDDGTGSITVDNAGTFAVQNTPVPADKDITTHTNYIRKYYTSAGAVTDGIVWSPAAGKRWHVTSLVFQTSAAATVTFEDDKAGGDDPVLKGEFAAGSGMALSFPSDYPFASGEDAADLIVTTSAGNIYVAVVGYEI